MSNQDEIKLLLERFSKDKTIIQELQSKYSINDILSVAIKNKMNDIIVALFQPIEINGEYEQFYDYYSVIDTYGIEYNDKEYLIGMQDVIDIDNPNTRNIKLKNSLAREVSGWAHPIRGEQDVRYYAEPACLESMIYFYRNNITTTMNDTECIKGEKDQGICKIWIRYDTLSDENKELVDKIIEEGSAKFIDDASIKTVSIFVPCQKEETIGIISDRIMNITKRFQKQVSYRGIMTTDTVMNILAKIVKEYLYNGDTIPNEEESYLDLFYKYVEEGLIKPLELSDYQITERAHELVQTEDGIFSIVDFLKIIKELEPEIIKDLISKSPYHQIYCDEDNRCWESKKYYDNYLEEKKQIEKEKSKQA